MKSKKRSLYKKLALLLALATIGYWLLNNLSMEEPNRFEADSENENLEGQLGLVLDHLTWFKGFSYPIEWSFTDSEVIGIAIGLYQGEQKVDSLLDIGLPEGQLTWSVNEDLESGRQYELRLTDASNGQILATSPIQILEPQPSWEAHRISTEGRGPDGVRLVDTNDDGLMDVISAYEQSGDIILYQHPGEEAVQQPWPSVKVGNVARGEDAFGFDVDQDGFVDVISSHEGDTMAIYIHWAPQNSAHYLNPKAWSTSVLPQSRGKGWMFALMMDVNQDGHPDIVAGAKDDYFNDRNSVGDVGWFEAPSTNKRDLSRWVYHSMDHAGWVMSLIPYDLDGDGDSDILVSDRRSDEEHQGTRWLENPGAHWDEEWESRFLGELRGTHPMFMAIGDIMGDHVAEIVVPLKVEDRLILLTQDTGKTEIDFESSIIPFRGNLPLGTLKASEIGDIDLDGKNDIVVTFVGGQIGAMWITYNDRFSNGTWEKNIITYAQNGKFDLVQLYDVDRDGDIDVLTTQEVGESVIVWFENPTIP